MLDDKRWLGTGGLATVDGLPFFLQAEILKPFISEELSMSTTNIKKAGASVKGPRLLTVHPKSASQVSPRAQPESNRLVRDPILLE